MSWNYHRPDVRIYEEYKLTIHIYILLKGSKMKESCLKEKDVTPSGKFFSGNIEKQRSQKESKEKHTKNCSV